MIQSWLNIGEVLFKGTTIRWEPVVKGAGRTRPLQQHCCLFSNFQTSKFNNFHLFSGSGYHSSQIPRHNHVFRQWRNLLKSAWGNECCKLDFPFFLSTFSIRSAHTLQFPTLPLHPWILLLNTHTNFILLSIHILTHTWHIHSPFLIQSRKL